MIALEKITEAFSSKEKTLALQSVSATGIANGLLLDMTMRQHYQNNSKKTLEVLYTFPMAWGATFMGLQAEIGGRKLVGTVIEKTKASEQYEKAIAEGDAPIMVEKNSDGIYMVNLGNLKPNEDVVIEYNYTQLLKYEQGSIRLTLPTVIAPRFGDVKKGGIKEHQDVENNFLAEYPFSLALDLTGGLELATIECPSHQVQVSKQNENLHVAIERQAFLDRDFILNLSGLKNQSFFIVTPDPEMGPEACTVLASFCPPKDSNTNENRVDLKILVDCSGSMEGDSITSAKRALHHVLSYLEPKDRFSYSKFGNYPTHLFSKLKKADQLYISAASLLIENTKADMGGTEIAEALESTFNIDGAEEKADVLLITDGEVWKTDETIAAARKSGHRIFAVGVGSAPAETLLKELAEQTGGACELISPKENIEKAIIRMFHRMRQPKAYNIEIDWGTNEQPEWTIGTNTAIFCENTTHVFAGFKSTPTKPALLSYQLGTKAQRFGIGAAEISHSKSANLPRLAAAQRIKTAPEGDQIALALRYQLITKNTNCLLVHVRAEEDKAIDLPELMNVAQMQAAGWAGTGTVIDQKARPRYCVARCAVIDNASISYDSYDMPRLFRSSRNTAPVMADLNSFAPAKDAINRNSDLYDIPAFLRKQTESLISKVQIAYLEPKDVIDRANAILKSKDQVDAFISSLNELPIEQEVSEVLNNDLSFLNKEELWIAVLAWLLINLEEYEHFNEKTTGAIEDLANNLDPAKRNHALQILNAKMADIGLHGWLTLDFDE